MTNICTFLFCRLEVWVPQYILFLTGEQVPLVTMKMQSDYLHKKFLMLVKEIVCIIPKSRLCEGDSENAEQSYKQDNVFFIFVALIEELHHFK